MTNELCDWSPHRIAYPLKRLDAVDDIDLRPLNVNDLDELCSFMTGDPEMTWTRKPWFRDNIEYMLSLRLDHYDRYGFGPYGILKEGNLIGMAGPQVWEKDACAIELLVYLARDLWGKNIASKLMSWLIDRAKQTGSIDVLYAATREENLRAENMMRRANFLDFDNSTHFGYPAISWKLNLT